MYFAFLAIGGYISAAMIWKRNAFGIVPAVIVSLFYLVFFPLGTIIAIIVFIKLFAEDTRDYLA